MSISDLTEADKGRQVVYHGNYGGPLEFGIITSWNDKYIFVRYGVGATSAATSPEDLTWAWQVMMRD